MFDQPQAQYPDVLWSRVDVARVDDREVEVVVQQIGSGISVFVENTDVPEKYQYRTHRQWLVRIASLSGDEYRAYHEGLAVVPMHAHWPLVLERMHAVEAL